MEDTLLFFFLPWRVVVAAIATAAAAACTVPWAMGVWWGFGGGGEGVTAENPACHHQSRSQGPVSVLITWAGRHKPSLRLSS